VVVATGHAQHPAVPAAAAHVPASVAQRVPTTFRGEADLPAGGVLVVGASATGLQVAEELARAGRRTILAVGSHLRLPRRYRGMDILWWLDRMGVFDVRADEVGDLERARRQHSWQLVGRPGGGDLDLVTARRVGVELTGRLVGVAGGVAHFTDDLGSTAGAADAALGRLLDRVDAHIESSGLGAEVLDAERPAPVVAGPGRLRLDLVGEGIGAVVWATGYRRSYPWLGVPVLDRRGEIRQRGGVTPCPGLYTVGLRFQTTRSSSFVDGARHDAAAVADLLAGGRSRHGAAASRQ
jgi:putative flavoprotein involved in K+ transport